MAPVFFGQPLLMVPEMKSECVSVTDVATRTRTVWQPSEARPPIQEVVWRHAPPISPLPKRFFRLSAVHGQLCEWICLWQMHESATRHTLSLFLSLILRKYSVNHTIATLMQRAYAQSSQAEMAQLRRLFDTAREDESGRSDAATPLSERPANTRKTMSRPFMFVNFGMH